MGDGCVDDPGEGGRAAAAINTVQLIFGAFGAGLAGIVVNATIAGMRRAARWMFAMFAVLAAVGFVASTRSGSRTASQTGSSRLRIVADVADACSTMR